MYDLQAKLIFRANGAISLHEMQAKPPSRVFVPVEVRIRSDWLISQAIMSLGCITYIQNQGI